MCFGRGGVRAGQEEGREEVHAAGKWDMRGEAAGGKRVVLCG